MGEVSLHVHRLLSAAQALDAGHLHGRRFKQNSGEEQAALGPLSRKVSWRPQHQNVRLEKQNIANVQENSKVNLNIKRTILKTCA